MRFGSRSGLLLMLAAAGCTATAVGESRYTPPEAFPPRSVVVVPDSLDVTRARLVQRLTRDRFAVSGDAEGATFLRFSLMTDRPDPHVDCGRVEGRYVGPRGKEETYSYRIGQRTSFKAADAEARPVAVTHRAFLEAKASISLAVHEDGTEVTVAVRYDLTVTDVSQPLTRDGRPLGEATSESRTIGFRSDSPAPPSGDLPGCAATGHIERAVLRAAQG